MTIRIGGSCIGHYGLNKPEMTTGEIRILQNNEHLHSWEQIQHDISKGIYVILNIDTYITGSRWNPSELELRNFVEFCIIKLKSYGGNKNNARFTWDNEPMEHQSVQTYIQRLAIIHDQIKGRFDLGAGNENMPLAADKGFYEALCARPDLFEVLDIHMQNSFETSAGIVAGTNYYKNLPASRKAVTEGSAFYKLPQQTGLLVEQINAAESIGCEDFCFVFPDWIVNTEEDGVDLSMCLNGQPKDITKYNEFVNFVKSKKPIIKRSVDGMIIRTIGFKDTDSTSGYPVLLVNELLFKNGFLAADKVGYAYTDYTKVAAINFIDHIREQYPDDPVKQLLKSDGRIGRQTIRYLIEAIPEEAEKYQLALEIMCSPITIEGAGV
ncbi:MAG: hypothetical protein Q8N27_06020 [Candidatus Hydromicrobium sp.]|nr:hypothetical protein [Candidatus Hydromicrobium sp.]